MSRAGLSPPSIANGVIAGSARHTSATRTGIPAQRESNDACKAKAAEDALALFSTEKTINLRGSRRLCLLLFQADSERALFWRDRNLVFARQPPNCPVEGGFVAFYRFLQFAKGQFALRVEHIPDRSGSLADFFFHCDSFSFVQSSPCECTPHLRSNGAGEARSCEPDLKVVRDLRLRCDGFGFDEFRGDAELLHQAQSVPVDIAFGQLAVREAGDGHSGDGELLPRWRNPAEIAFMGTVTGPTGHDGFTFGNDVLDGQLKVREGGAVKGRPLPFTLRAPPKIGRRRVMVSVVGGKELVCHRQIALVPKFFKQTTDDSFVLF